MDTSRQVLRWSIPGWLFLFLSIVFGWIGIRTNGLANLQSLFSLVPSQKYGVEIAALLAAAGVPLGFIIYQIYFYMYGSVLPFSLVNIDRGIDILGGLPAETLERITDEIGIQVDTAEMTEEVKIPLLHAPLHRLKKPYRNKKDRSIYEARLRANWEIVRSYLTRISVHTKTSDVSKEFICLSDIYHSLGASRVGLLLAYAGWVSYIGLKCLLDANSIWRLHFARTCLGLVFVSLLFAFLNSVLTRNRDKALISSQSFLRHTYYAFFAERSNNVGSDIK